MFSLYSNLDHALSRLRSGRSVTGLGGGGGGSLPPIGAAPAGDNPFRRFAQSQVIYTQPQFYSPLHTPQNWQIPSKRREVYQWLRYFSENEPKVAAALDFYAAFPMNGFETQCDNTKIKQYFDHLNKKLQLDQWVKMISREYYMIGDVFPFLEINCDRCNGTNIDPRGGMCEHKGGSWKRLVVLNPDWIDVQANQFTPEPVITLLPDDELKRVCWHKKPKELHDRLPPHIRQLILAGRPIPLDNQCISHLKYNPYPYGVYGTSIIRRLFKVLTYKDKLMTAQWVVAERLILPIRVVKIGDADRPAGPADIADVQQQLAQTANDPNLTLVTHHAFDYDWIGASGKVLTLSNEFDLINKEILQGLMLNEALLSGEMAGYQSAAIGAEAMIQRLESWRLELARWIEERIYKPVAKMRGFIDEAASDELGEPVYIYPHIKWNDLNLRDDSQQKQLWMQLHERQAISTQTLLEKFGEDYDQEVERLRFETAEQNIGAMAGGAAGGMGAPGGGGGGGLFGGGAGGGPAGPAPGGAPGSEMGGPPVGGPMGAPGGGMGMGAPGGMPAAASAAMGGSQGKILGPGRKAKQLKPMEEETAMPARIPLTSLEQTMYKIMHNLKFAMRMPFDPWVQYPLGPYRADFAIPQLRLDIECDGDVWHSDPEKVASDKLRDAKLAQFGWTIVRFSESELQEQPEAVQNTVASLILKLWKKALEQQDQAKQKTASITSMTTRVAELAQDDMDFMEVMSRSYVVSFVSPALGVMPFMHSYAELKGSEEPQAEIESTEQSDESAPPIGEEA